MRLVALVLALAGCAAAPRVPPGPAPVVVPTVAAELPHDPTAFTQGLVLDGGVLFESSGGYGASTLRRVEPATGAVRAAVRLGDAYFAEGLALLGGRLYLLTLHEETVFVFDPATLAPLDTLRLPGDAWGLAADGDRLVLSDGTDRLRWLDPATLATVREVRVHDAGEPVHTLNELEVVDGLVYANVWPSGRIAAIDPATGAVVRWLDLEAIAQPHRSLGRGPLNGIAYDPATGRLLVTGKLWPTLYVLDPLPDRD